ncbi:MAG: phosphoglycerate dehydrogenase [Spirochaetales bacterium]|jgi:D-3-phosphoglycerate dehydrogenase|nr:phosphoglycerate dehydrogenase [Spirochaetales bacterium]
MEKMKVLITPRSLSKSGHPALDKLEAAGIELLMPWPGRQPAEEELARVLPECFGYLAGVEQVSAEVLTSCPKLKVISRNGVGLDNVDIAAAEKMGIKVLGTPGANSQGVAELALALLLGGMRSVTLSSTRLKAGSWDRVRGTEVQGKTLGILGCGQIGQRLAGMAIGIGMQVIGYDLYPSEEFGKTEGFRYAQLDDLAGNADAVSLHCPPGENPLVTRNLLKKMTMGGCIINTARAGLVDAEALLEALQTGKVSHYAVDAFDTEPPVLTELLLHDRVTLTPHIGGFTEESVQRSAEAAVENILKAAPKE